MRRAPLLAVVSIAMMAFSARADTGIPVDVGARVGFAIPFGDSDARGGAVSKMSDLVSWGLPIQLDAAYRITQDISAGLYVQYSPYLSIPSKALGGGCGQGGVSCSGSLWRFGVEGFYRIPGKRSFQPWVGLGIGKEWAAIDFSGGGVSGTGKSSGWEYLNLQAGADWVVYPSITVGPALMFTLGQYADQEISQSGFATSSYTLGSSEQKFHYWISIGVRGTYHL
jgi:hypothetical protein